MNTNSDAFENELRALQRRGLPADWRDDILRAATVPSRTPRWLITGWSAAWAAIVVMYFTTPAEPLTPAVSAQTPATMRWEERAALIEDLLAAN